MAKLEMRRDRKCARPDGSSAQLKCYKLILILLFSHILLVCLFDFSGHSYYANCDQSTNQTTTKVISAQQQQQNASAANASSSTTLRPMVDQISGAESSVFSTQSEDRSHRIIAGGWPNTSPMWPSVEMAADSPQSFDRPIMAQVEPFIYADKPHASDYSLLLDLNNTLISMLKKGSENGHGIAVTLSFEYYFNYAPNTTALPAIRIEVDRKQFKYLEPSLQQDSQQLTSKRSITQVRARMWIAFNEQLQVVDAQQFDKHDWLKFSLINRQAPSLVAIRKLRVEFKLDSALQSAAAQTTTPAPAQEYIEPVASPPPPPPPSLQPLPPPPPPPTRSQSPAGNSYVDEQLPVNNWSPQPTRGSTYDERLAPPPSTPVRPPPPPPPPPSSQVPPQSPLDQVNNGPSGLSYEPVDQNGVDQVPAASSQALTSTIKPVDPKKKGGWFGLGKRRRRRRRKRQANPQPNSESGQPLEPVVLECYRADACDHWRSDSSASGQIQWSLARMPPSTQWVRNGYFYASNRQNYGDSTKVFKVALNQTDAATESDKRADHCIELAIYVTERARLQVYRYTRRPSDSTHPLEPDSTGGQLIESDAAWLRGPLLLEWSPTLVNASAIGSGSTPATSAVSGRARVAPSARIRAIEEDRAGWTLDKLCFGDFFANASTTQSDLCGSVECAFGFQMALPASTIASAGRDTEATGEPMLVASQQSQADSIIAESHRSEQVVGVALVREFGSNEPFQWPSGGNKWLQTWQRKEVKPTDEWRFYPSMDYEFSSDNVSLVNLYDNAIYYVESEWLAKNDHLDLHATLLIERISSASSNSNSNSSSVSPSKFEQAEPVFSLYVVTRLVDSNYAQIYSVNSTLDWPPISLITSHSLESSSPNSTAATTSLLYNLTLPLSSHLNEWQRVHELGELMFKIAMEMRLSVSAQTDSAQNGLDFKLTLENVSLSDRCYPSPCEHGECKQNGTGPNDWECNCDQKYRGRKCEFARWCQLPHVTLGAIALQQQQQRPMATQQQQQQVRSVLTTSGGNNAQQVIVQQQESAIRVTGREFCARKLGQGSECSELDLALNDETYSDEGITFRCACRDDFYLSDEGKCKQAHQCNSIVCPTNQFCDETRPFNQTEPCKCNEKLDWHKDPLSNKCVRRQCLDRQRDCGFQAHICLPTLAGERPICKCREKFALKTNDRGLKYCESTACVLPTLNDCEQICEPISNSTDLERPYRCDCHPGFTLTADGRSCKPSSSSHRPHCKPACHSETQICTEDGCKCKQGFVADGEVIVKRPSTAKSTSSHQVDYIQSARCLNKCSLSYAENKDEFERIESVCPLGLCDEKTFECSCSDQKSSALVNTKYEPIFEELTEEEKSSGEHTRKRKSPLCHLRRVCEPNASVGYRQCRERGAICVPDFTKAAMFDCVCPPGTEKRQKGANELDFVCEPKCSSIRSECLLKQAVCRLVDKDAVRCECLPGFMLDSHEHKCYLTKYSYSFNLVLVNKYYEPDSSFRRAFLAPKQHTNRSAETDTGKPSTTSKDLVHPISELVPPAAQVSPAHWRSIFIAEYNQCNLTQIIPKAIIEDPYETDMETYLQYIEQCNEKLHESARMSHLNSRLSEDIRQALRQHLNEFSVTTNQSDCNELENTNGLYLNCTIYLQSHEPIAVDLVEGVFSRCDKKGADGQFCWIKPRLLLRKPAELSSATTSLIGGADQNKQKSKSRLDLNFKQVIPCELNGFCGDEAQSVRLDELTSLCSCKCPADIELNDIKVLYPRTRSSSSSSNCIPMVGNSMMLREQYPIAYKEVCAPRDHCGLNSTFCSWKPNSKCHYDLRVGSRCLCVFPAYEDSQTGACVEVSSGPIGNTLIVVIVLLGIALLVSIGANLYALARSRSSLFGHSKQYPLSEFRSTTADPSEHRHYNESHRYQSRQQQQQQQQPTNRMSRSTGVPNLSFTNDDE